MLDALKSLFENNVLSEEIKADLETAWTIKIQENRDQVTALLREEFAQKFEHDKTLMVEAIDQMISDKLHEELSEFSEDRRALAEAKAQYKVAIREHSNKLQHFVLESLASEIAELHEDQKILSANFEKIEEFIVTALSKEITDFYKDKQDLADTKVRLVKEAKEQFDTIKSKFIKQSAGLVESIVSKALSSEISQLKEDISFARENDFGRKIFEAFSSEFQLSVLNEKTESAKLLKQMQQKDQQLAEAKKIISKQQVLVENKDLEIGRVKDVAQRKEIMNELLSPLNKDQRSIMGELLESVQTSKLRIHYDRYLPTVINNNTPARKQVLSESVEITGNKSSKYSAGQGEVIEIRRLAGLK